MTSLLSLILIFAYVGLLTIGGGLVAIPIMQQEIITKRALITLPKFISMIAISESTPGPIGINMATYIGYELHGVFGAIMTSVGTTIPSIVIIIIIAKFLRHFHEKPLINAAFLGLRPATTGMIAVAAMQIFVIALFNIDNFNATGALKDLFIWKNFAFYCAACIALFRFKIHPVWAIFLGALFGIIFL